MEEMDFTRKFSLGDQRDPGDQGHLGLCLSGVAGEGV